MNRVTSLPPYPPPAGGRWGIVPAEERDRLAGTLGALLIELRAERQMSAAELARRSGVSASHISGLQRGIYRPRPAVLASLARGLTPEDPAQLVERLHDAAGASLRPDTEPGLRRRRRREERAASTMRRAAQRAELAAKMDALGQKVAAARKRLEERQSDPLDLLAEQVAQGLAAGVAPAAIAALLREQVAAIYARPTPPAQATAALLAAMLAEADRLDSEPNAGR
jgi:transcriptional regulator with XRE-family HTH domain